MCDILSKLRQVCVFVMYCTDIVRQCQVLIEATVPIFVIWRKNGGRQVRAKTFH